MPVLKNARWEAFARRRVAAMIHPETVKDSVRAIAPGLTESSYKVQGLTLPKRPEIIRRMQELAEARDLQLARAEASAPNALRTLRDMSLQEFVDYLVQAISTPVGLVDEYSPLAQEVTTESTKLGERRRVKMVGKSEAMALLAKVKGWAAEHAISISFPGFAATVRNVGPVAAPECPPSEQQRGAIDAETVTSALVPEFACDAAEGREMTQEEGKETAS